MKKCEICNSYNKVCNSPIGYLCGKHYIQYLRYGEIKHRTKYDPNEIKIYEDYSEIILYNSKGEGINKALIDTDVIENIKLFKWCLDKNGYVKNSKQQYLHRIILNEKKLYIDHINGNKLDNRKINLRVCNNSDNLKNRVKLPRNNISGTIGVRYREDRNKWYAEIQANKIKINLGSFKTKEEAIRVRKEAEIKYFKNFKSIIL